MSRIQINLDHAHSVRGDLNQKVNRLPNVKSGISSMVYQVDSQIAGRRNIRSRLNRVSHSTQELEMRLRDLKVFIDSSLDKYRRTEALLVQMSLGVAGIQSNGYYGSNGRAGANGVSLAYDFIGPPVYKDGSMNSCPAPTPEPKLNPFMKAWKSIQGIGSDIYDVAENRADHAGDSFPAFLDYLTMGIPSGAYKAAEDRANRMMDSPFDFVNWATFGISGMADEALLPNDPLSKEHLSSSFGLASLLAGGTLAASGRSSFSMRTSKGDTGSSSIEGTGEGGGVDSKIGVVSEGSGGQNLLSSIGKVDKAPSTVKYLEDGIRNEPFEHGLFFDKDGKVIGRLVSDGELAKIDLSSYKDIAKDTTFTHNHPNSSRFSIADLETAVYFDMAEIRAVTPNGVTFSIKRGTGRWAIHPLDVEKVFKQTQRELSSDPMVQALFKEGNTEAVWDILYSKMAGKIGGDFSVYK